MMKNILAMMIAVLMILSLLTACGAKAGQPAEEAAKVPEEAAPVEEAAEEAEQPAELPAILPGGWAAAESPELTDEILDVFRRATEGLLGVDYEPLAYLGSQLVNGTNHAVFCRAVVVYPDAKPYYLVMHIHEALDGSVEILDMTSFDPSGEIDENAQAAEPVMGGWSAPESDEEGFAALEKAVEGLVGAGYSPVCVMGRQVVNGTNFCLLCRIVGVYPGALPSYAFVTVYQSLDGGAEISAITELDASGMPA